MPRRRSKPECFFVAFKDGQATLVQCKLWRNWQVKPNHVRELLGAMTKHEASKCALAINAGFTHQAQQEAVEGGVELLKDVLRASLFIRKPS